MHLVWLRIVSLGAGLARLSLKESLLLRFFTGKRNGFRLWGVENLS